MKSVFILLVLIFTFYVGNAQHFAIASDNNNVLYVGLDNPLSISAENCPCSQLIVKTNNGKVITENGLIKVKDDKKGKDIKKNINKTPGRA